MSIQYKTPSWEHYGTVFVLTHYRINWNTRPTSLITQKPPQFPQKNLVVYIQKTWSYNPGGLIFEGGLVFQLIRYAVYLWPQTLTMVQIFYPISYEGTSASADEYFSRSRP
jgi:hypothetical protein